MLIADVPCNKPNTCSLGIRSGTTYICWLGTDGKVDARKYLTTDSDASKVSDSKSSIDSTKEVSCTRNSGVTQSILGGTSSNSGSSNGGFWNWVKGIFT